MALKIFDPDNDPHQLTADMMSERLGRFVSREEGKRENYRVVYGVRPTPPPSVRIFTEFDEPLAPRTCRPAIQLALLTWVAIAVTCLVLR